MRIEELPTPCYVVDEKKLKENLMILNRVRQETGCKILLAQKAFSMFYEYPLIGRYLDGTTASGLYEARLGRRRWERKTISFPRLTRKRILRRSRRSVIILSLIPFRS